MFKFSQELKNFLQSNQGKKIVFTNGCFDILHRGHVAYLNEARKLGDRLVVGLNSDESVRKLKGADRPINSESDRKYIIENLKAVDFVEIFPQETPLQLIETIAPKVLVKGGDWPIESIVGHELVLGLGGKVLSLSFIEGRSTTELIKQVQGRS